MLHLERRGKKGGRREAEHTHHLTLLHASKPHTKSLSSLAVDWQGKILATGVSRREEGREGVREGAREGVRERRRERVKEGGSE